MTDRQELEKLQRKGTVRRSRDATQALAAAPAVGREDLRQALTNWFHSLPTDFLSNPKKCNAEFAALMRCIPAAQPASPLRGREIEALAKMVYEAVRFANWAAGEGFCPASDCAEAIDPAIILSDCINAVEHFDGDDWSRLAGIASDAILSSAGCGDPNCKETQA